VDSIPGPAASDELWLLVARAVADADWGGVTVDALVSYSNVRALRFWSRFLEPCSEAVDALCVPDWARTRARLAVPPTWRCCSPPLRPSWCGLLWRRRAQTAHCAS
jgi:hypothetical protein